MISPLAASFAVFIPELTDPITLLRLEAFGYGSLLASLVWGLVLLRRRRQNT
jgi:hypothetical protein